MTRSQALAIAGVVLWPLLTAGACATTREAPVRTVEVKVPVARSCVPASLGAAPIYPDTDAALKAGGGAADRYQLMAAGRLLRDQRLKEVEPVVAGCR